jgi:hypothetical protein
MPENTSKLLGLLEDLAIIADDAVNIEGLISASINTIRLESDCKVKVHMDWVTFTKLKKHYPGKAQTKDFTETHVKESMMFFDIVDVFSFTEKPKPEVDINVVEPAQAAAI